MSEAISETGQLMPSRLIFTDQAIQRTYELMVEKNNLDLKLRLFIVGGGCAGFQYGFAFDDHMNADDVVIKKTFTPKKQDVYLLIDPISFLYLSQATVDYVDDSQYARFVVHNPNVQTGCRCPHFQETE